MEANTIKDLTDCGLDISKNLIYNANLTSTIERLIKVEKWSKDEALEAVKQYRNFLFLKRKYGDSHVLPPSYDMDEVWHAHILHTKEYCDFCEEVFGSYLHHHPHHGIKNEITDKDISFAFENETQRLYFAEFGEYIYAVKPPSWLFIIKGIVKDWKKILKACRRNDTSIKSI
ncbi:MAG: glycine-rich domain-containing protein-like [Proteobacteria bacterium]|nr:glycine-rich domain-containing protein-like [Pseudomonadota bacterium]